MADELTRLGLSHRSARLIVGKGVWTELARLVKPRSPVLAALAGVGAGGAGLVQFTRGSTIVTNASRDAIRLGVTDPGVLLRWVEAGANVYGLEDVEATLLVAEGSPPFVITGSGSSATSASKTAPSTEAESAALVSDDPESVREARSVLSAWARRAGETLTAPALRDLIPEFGVDRASAVKATVVSMSQPAAAVSGNAGSAVGRSTSATTPSNSSAPTRTVTIIPPKISPAPAKVFGAPSELPAGPRPRTLTVTGILRRGEPSAEAEARLEELKTEHEGPDKPGIVDMFWWELAPGSYDVRLYRNGEYIVGVDLAESNGRRQKRCPLWPPGRVLHSYTDGAAWPVRVYCYLLVAGTGEAPTLGDLQTAVLTIGEKLEFDRGYMRDFAINTILGLWPDVTYSDS